MSHGVTPEPPAGSAHYREGWRDGYVQHELDVRDRDEAAKAVARLWDGTVYDTTNDNPLWGLLDALARAHEEA